MPKLANAEPVGFSINSAGYRILTMQYGHPLAGANGTVLEHRKVLYDAIGPGPHPCHWRDRSGCRQLVLTWDQITVDHLDEDKLHNDPGNLVVSCFVDNIHRTRYERSLGRMCALCGGDYYAKDMCRRHYNQAHQAHNRTRRRR